MAGPDLEVELVEFIASFHHDPLGFAKAVFPWGEVGGPLEGLTGPRAWQAEVLDEMGKELRAGADLAAVMQPVLEAISSGHGIGKSALVSWVIIWALSTMEDSKVVVTADTAGQLATKTWPELRKWHRLAVNAHWFEYTATSLHSVDKSHEKTWRADAIPWSDHHPEAFAGLHNKGRRVVLIFDEASGISDAIWDVAEGALTDEDTEIVWLAFGNPTRNTGRFRECFGKRAHRWKHRQIDSRTVDGTNKIQIDKWIADYGEDSDFVRVRVRGVFPTAGTNQFIPSDIISAAASPARRPLYNTSDPVIVGVDVARFGDDESTIYTRKGRDCRTIPAMHFRGMDTMQLAARVAAHLQHLEKVGAPADAVFIDEGGIGGAVIDRMRQMGYRVIGVNNGSPADGDVEGIMVRNKAAEMWQRAKLWLGTTADGGALPYDNPDLCAQLEGREFYYDDKQRIVLESKDDMAARGVGSPDRADGFTLTFAQHVGSAGQRAQEQALYERKAYDPLRRVRKS